VEKFVQLNAKVRRSGKGFAITIFINDALLEKAKSFGVNV
jgi:hypothetical protein